MKQNVYKTVLLAVGLVLCAVALYVYFPSQKKLTRITVFGDSLAETSPDTAVITFSVLTQSKQAITAQQENAKKSEAVKLAVEALTKDSVTEIKTSDYSLNPEQNYYSGKMPKIIGYEVKNTVTISINDTAKVGAIIDAATNSGANSVEGIKFVVGEASPAQGNALALATKQAMAKAETIARSLNGKIIRVIETQEGGIPFQTILPEYNLYESSNMSMDRKSYETPIQAGSVKSKAQVLLIVEIEVD